MNLIGRHIEYLVRYNDCVVVPGWGAFISRYQPALLGKDGKFLPPTRSLSFNQSLTHDDGLLASSIVRKSKVSYDAAMKQIANEVAVMRHQLTQNGEIAISNIGVFRQNGEGAIIFDPFINTSATLRFDQLKLLIHKKNNQTKIRKIQYICQFVAVGLVLQPQLP